MALNLLFAFIGTGIIFLLLKVLDVIYKVMLIPVEKVDAGAAQKYAFNTVAYTISQFESFYHNGKK